MYVAPSGLSVLWTAPAPGVLDAADGAVVQGVPDHVRGVVSRVRGAVVVGDADGRALEAADDVAGVASGLVGAGGRGDGDGGVEGRGEGGHADGGEGRADCHRGGGRRGEDARGQGLGDSAGFGGDGARGRDCAGGLTGDGCWSWC